jgi:hypothetical protein
MARPEPAAASAAPPGGLRLPLGSILQRLNADTAATASGEYTLLHQLGDALRDRIDGFLHWVTAR